MVAYNQVIEQRILESIEAKTKLLEDKQKINFINHISQRIIASLRNGGKLILAGNGGSYGDSIHIAGEFVSRFRFDRAPLAAVALGSNNTILTAIGNDYGYEDIFYREFKAIAKQTDVLLCLSTSGNSPNIIKLVELAKNMGIITFAMSGKDGGVLEKKSNCLKVPSFKTERIQEMHIMVGHIICEIVEETMFSKE